MRKILLIIAITTAGISQAQTKRNIETKIEKVTVFLDGAQVERTTKTNLTNGKQELIFNNISPSIDKQSIQVKADNNAVTVLSVIHQQNFLKEQQKQDEIKEIENLKEAQLEKIALQKNILSVYKQEEDLMVKNQQIGGANNGLKAADLKDAADFQRSRLTEIYQKQMEASRILKKLDVDLLKINKQLAHLKQNAETATSEIHVTVNTSEAATAQFTVSYLVKQAGWFPTYDIRVKDVSSPIKMDYKANVIQNSGEDWKDIKLFLSTGNPNENGTKPNLTPWYLKYTYAYRPATNTIQATYQQSRFSGIILDTKGNPIPGASVVIKGSKTGAATDTKGNFQLNAKPGDIMIVSSVGFNATEMVIGNLPYQPITLTENNNQMAEVVVTALGQGVQSKELGYSPILIRGMKSISSDMKRNEDLITTITYQPTTTVYEIKEPYTILNDGKTYMATIDGYEVKADYEYYIAPKLDPDAYLTAKIIDWQQLNLLPGEANLFFEGTFLGKSVLDLINAGDTLNLSLGKDKGVVAKRTLIEEYSTKKFMGSNRTDTRQYEIVVRNNKQQPIHVIVEDQFPISTQKEIEVQDRKYEGAKLDEDSQILTWQMKIEARKENKIGFKYEVKYPKGKLLQLE